MAEPALAQAKAARRSARSRQASASPEVQRLREHLDSRLIGLRVDRFSWWTHWRELASYILPRRYKWLITPNQGNRGSPINQSIVDSTGSIALRILASGMMAGITSPGRPWFKLMLDNKDLAKIGAVKDWLDECRDRMLNVMGQSNYYNTKAVQYQDIALIGSAPVVIYEDYEDVIRCHNFAAGEYYLANSDRMQVDTIYREFVLTTRQVADKFGVENCSASIQSAIKTGGASLTREVVIAHAIEPNTDRVPQAPGVRGMPYREVYWEWGQGQNLILQSRGFHEFPGSAPRWDIIGNDAYGRSPAMDALGDIKQLQVEQKRKAQGIDKMVNPPLLADVSLKNEPASVLPGGVTYTTNVKDGGMRPIYNVDPKVDHLTADIKDVQMRIKEVFYNDLFLLFSQLDTTPTPTDVDQRREEKLIQLGPVLERFQNESLDPEIDRIFNIMLRARLFPPPPRQLVGQNIRVEYISMLAASQRAASTAAIERLVAFVGRIGGAVNEALDNIDWDEAIEEYADMLGVPPKLVRPIIEVMKIRQQRAADQAKAQAAQNAMALTQGAANLSKTEVGGGLSALQVLGGTQ